MDNFYYRNTMIKYIVYCRKSLGDEGRQIMSIVAQQTEIKEFAKRENLDIIEWFIETKIARAKNNGVDPDKIYFPYLP